MASIATTSAMAQSTKTNAWEGFYGQIGVGFGIFTPSISNGKAVAPAPYSAANIDKDSLAYAKVGYTGATIGLSAPSIAYTTTNLTGWTLGIGYKQMATSSLYAFGEVNYAQYGSKGIATITSSSGAVLSGMSAKGTGTDILVGVGYRF